MAYISNFSDRVLKNKIDPEVIFGRVIYYDESIDEIKTLKMCKNKDFKAGVSWNLDSNGEGILILDFKNIELYNLIVDNSQTYPLAFQIFTIKSDEKKGLFYFFNKIIFEHNPLENTILRQIEFLSFSSAFEKTTIVEHTKEYDFTTLPIDESGKKILPEDYNTIIYKGLTFASILTSIWSKNVGDNTSTPINRVKGDYHMSDIDRKFKGIIGMAVIDNVDFPAPANLITYSSGKKSMFEIKQGVIGVLKGQGINKVPILDFTIDENLPLLQATYTFENDILIENGVDIKDNYTFLRKELDQQNDIVDVLIENSNQDNYYYRDKIGVKPFQWKNKEAIGSGTIEEGGTSIDLKDNAIDVAGTNEILDLTNLAVDFRDKIYFIDVRAGQNLTLIGYGSLIDGTYLIKKISAVFEETHISYAIDEIERIEGGLV